MLLRFSPESLISSPNQGYAELNHTHASINTNSYLSGIVRSASDVLTGSGILSILYFGSICARPPSACASSATGKPSSTLAAMPGTAPPEIQAASGPSATTRTLKRSVHERAGIRCSVPATADPPQAHRVRHGVGHPPVLAQIVVVEPHAVVGRQVALIEHFHA